ncbi:uncharacterized protein ACNS7B_021512 isoform 2-T2 [Menidia menidia]
MENTEAEMGLEFHKTINEIPKQEAVQEVLVKAANTSSSEFNITIATGSITITKLPGNSNANLTTVMTPTSAAETTSSATNAATMNTTIPTNTTIIPKNTTATPPTTTVTPPTTTVTPTNTTATPTNTTDTSPTTTDTPPTTTVTPPTTTITPPTTTVTPTTTTDTPTNTTYTLLTTTVTPPTATVTTINTTVTPPTTTVTSAVTTVTLATTTATPATTTVTPATTTVSTPPTTTEAPAPIFVLAAVVVEPFVPELNDRDSQPFKVLERKVTFMYDVIYRAQFGLLFIRSFVIAFRPAAARTRMEQTEAEMGIEFNKSTPIVEIPKQEDVQEVLIKAVNTSSNEFNITIESDSIKITQTPANPTAITIITSPTPTSALTNASTTTSSETAPATNATSTKNTTISPSTTSTSALTNASTTTSSETAPATNAITTKTTTISPSTTSASALTNASTTTSSETAPATNAITTEATTTSPSTTASTTTTSATTAEATRVKRVTFRSAGEKFTSDLLNPSSAAFMERAAVIKSTLEPLYRRPFPSFRSLTVVSFSNGSIINNMDLTFALVSIPNNTEIAKVLTTASPNITAFNIDVNSIFVEGSQISSGVSHKISLITASCMVLSWLLSSQQ